MQYPFLSKKKFFRWDSRWLIFFMGFPFLLFFLLKNKSITLTWDGYIYLALAQNISEGRGFTLGTKPHLFHSPLFPFLIAGMKNCFHLDVITSAHLLCTLFFSLNIFLIFSYCKHYLRSQRIGFYAILIYILSERVQRYSIATISENVLTPLYGISILLSLSILLKRKYGFYKWIGLTLSMAAAYYCKPEALAIYLILTGFIVLFSIRRKDRFFPILRMMGISLILFFVCMIPNMIRIKEYTGDLSISGKSKPILFWAYCKHNNLVAPIEVDKYFFFEHTVEDAFVNFVNYSSPPFQINLLYILKNIFAVPVPYVYKFLGALWTILILYYLAKNHRWKSAIFLLPAGMVISIFILIMLLYPDPRFIIPLVPWLSIYAASLYLRILPKFNKSQYQYLFFIILILTEYPFTWCFQRDYYTPITENVIHAISKENDTSKVRIATNKISYCFMNGMDESYLIPRTLDTEDELCAYIKLSRPKYTIIEASRRNKNPAYVQNLFDSKMKYFNVVMEYPSNEKEAMVWVLALKEQP